MDKIKIGVVGAGNIAVNAHLPAYAKYDGASVEAICDTVPERAKEAAKKFNIPRWYSSVEEMLEGCEIDAVDICTWNNGHCPVAISAARAGKHIMCEKPMARTMEEAQAMADAVRKSGVKFMLAVPNRSCSENRKARELIESGALGDIYFARASVVRRRGTPTGWFTDFKTSGGGPIIDIGVHRIDAAWYLMGCPKPVSVTAATSNRIGDYQTKGVGRWQGTPCPDNKFDVEDSGAGCIRFENGAIMLFEATWAINAPAMGETLVCGSKAGIRLEPLTVFGEKDGYLNDEKIDVHAEGEDAFFNEIEAFCDYLRGKCPSRVPLDQALTLQSMLNAAYESAKTGKEIIL